MKVYISGKISDLPTEQVKAKFAQAEAQVISYGHTPVNPLKNGLEISEHWNKHLAADIALLLECDAIYLLTDWEDSKGARIENHIAEEMGFELIRQPKFAEYKPIINH